MLKFHLKYISMNINLGQYSATHITFLVTLIIICITLIIFNAKGLLNKTNDLLITRIYFLILLCLEIAKQIVLTKSYGYYRFEFFPFQICSIPLYVSGISSFIRKKNAKLNELLDIFLSYLGLLAGLSVMISGIGDAISSNIPFLPINSYIWHSLMVIYSLYLLLKKKLYLCSFKQLAKTYIIFFAFSLVAITLNEIVYHTYLVHIQPSAINASDRINMFYISYHYPTNYPFVKSIKDNAYPLFLVLFYIITFGLYIGVAYLFKGIKHLSSKCFFKA